jgi:HAD superfamily hydrolase (TIGR01549 family)
LQRAGVPSGPGEPPFFFNSETRRNSRYGARLSVGTLFGAKALTRYRAWLIDLDGTLYHPQPVKWAMAAEVLLGSLWNRSTLPGIRQFRRHHEQLRREMQEPVESPYHLQLQQAADALGWKVDRLEALILEWMQQRPGKWIRLFRRRSLLEEIRQHRDGGGRTALVSDYPASHKLQSLQLSDLFEVVIANGEADGPGRLKPWPDGFLRAAQKLAVEPAECLVLGDRQDADGQAAERAGMAFRLIR